MRRRSVTGAEVGPTPVTDAVTGGASALPLALEVPEVLRVTKGSRSRASRGFRPWGSVSSPCTQSIAISMPRRPSVFGRSMIVANQRPSSTACDRRAAAAGAHQPDVLEPAGVLERLLGTGGRLVAGDHQDVHLRARLQHVLRDADGRLGDVAVAGLVGDDVDVGVVVGDRVEPLLRLALEVEVRFAGHVPDVARVEVLAGGDDGLDDPLAPRGRRVDDRAGLALDLRIRRVRLRARG